VARNTNARIRGQFRPVQASSWPVHGQFVASSWPVQASSWPVQASSWPCQQAKPMPTGQAGAMPTGKALRKVERNLAQVMVSDCLDRVSLRASNGAIIDIHDKATLLVVVLNSLQIFNAAMDPSFPPDQPDEVINAACAVAAHVNLELFDCFVPQHLTRGRKAKNISKLPNQCARAHKHRPQRGTWKWSRGAIPPLSMSWFLFTLVHNSHAGASCADKTWFRQHIPN